MIKQLLAAAGLLLAQDAAIAASPALLPQPAAVVAGQGSFTLAAGTTIAVPRADSGASNAADRLVELMGRTRGIALRRSDRGPIRFVRAGGFAREAYRLAVTPAGATITASDDVGLLYGAVTLWQLATTGRSFRIDAVTIDDSPRFRWRGLMLDSARHYQSPAFIRTLIDAMMANKLNILHWHLVDDQGWRLEIRKYPKLTQIGGWRIPASAPGAPKLPKTGGFYTQDEVRALVAYAAARGITIVPEIEMPGHALSAIRAYPELGVGPSPPPGIESDWGVFPYLYNIDDKTFGFLEDVLSEVMALFPSPYIHVGGDEAVKDQWHASAAVQARMRVLGLADERALQSWFVQRIGKFLAAHGRRLIGWNEILEGGLAPDATVMSWQGIDGAIAAAKAGHDAVLAPAPTLYFDHRQGTTAAEPPGRGAPITLADVYRFDPAPASLDIDQQRHLLGLQGNLWTEHVRTDTRAADMLFPRASAVAELGWSPRASHDYAGFITRLWPQLARLKSLGLAARDPRLAQPAIDAADVDSTRLKTCSGKLDLYLEDDAPAVGPRAKYLIDILAPCWIYASARLDGIASIALDVGQLPFNFQVGAERDAIRFRPPATPDGEFEIRLDSCDGPRIAVLPLSPAKANPAVTTLRARLTPTLGRHDLCLSYTANGPDPLWAIDRVRLEAGR